MACTGVSRVVMILGSNLLYILCWFSRAGIFCKISESDNSIDNNLSGRESVVINCILFYSDSVIYRSLYFLED